MTGAGALGPAPAHAAALPLWRAVDGGEPAEMAEVASALAADASVRGDVELWAWARLVAGHAARVSGDPARAASELGGAFELFDGRSDHGGRGRVTLEIVRLTSDADGPERAAAALARALPDLVDAVAELVPSALALAATLAAELGDGESAVRLAAASGLHATLDGVPGLDRLERHEAERHWTAGGLLDVDQAVELAIARCAS